MDASVHVFGSDSDLDALVARLLEHLPEASFSRRQGIAVLVTPLPPGSAHLVSIEVHPDRFAGVAGEQERRRLGARLRDAALEGPGLAWAVEALPRLRTVVALVPEEPPTAATEASIWALAGAIATWTAGFSLSLDGEDLRGPSDERWATTPEPPDAPVGAPVEPVAEPVDDAPAQLDLATGPQDGSEPWEVQADRSDERPTAGRAVARLLAMVAVAARALGERDGRVDAATCATVQAWCEGVGTLGELEPAEATLLGSEPGTVPLRAVVDCSWTTEAAAVLAWSLRLLELPPHDVLVDPGALFAAVGFPDVDETIARLAPAQLRSRPELDERRMDLMTVHWRVRELATHGTPVDFTVLAQDEGFPLDAARLPLVDGDLAVDGAAIAAAPRVRQRLVASAALERHRAATWLAEGGTFSEVDTGT
ncbi:hypothetical protein BH10ACT1_BH10ACT1_29020 [soil metagenome]